MDRKAIRTFRANMVVSGLLITALSFAVQAESLALSQFLNIYAALGLFFLIGSTMLSGTAYLASSYEAGIGPDGLIDVRTEGFSEREFLKELAEWSESWLLLNSYVVGYNATFLTLTVISVINYTVFFTFGLIIGGLQLKATSISWGTLAALSVVMLVIDYVIFRIEDPILWYYDLSNDDHPDVRH